MPNESSSAPTTSNTNETASPFPNLSLPATTDPPSYPDNPPVPKTWLIFGATGHIGRSIVRSALQHGDYVCAVGQTYKNSLSSMLNLLPDPNSPEQRGRFLPLLCDVRLRNTVASAIEACQAHFDVGAGGIDIIANCTGYGVIGAFEDQDDHEIRNQFETNFMGTLNIIQLSLPYFRERGDGRYVIFSSTSGAQGVPGLAPYCATKYAVEGLIESMLYEVDGFGVKVTLVEVGHVRRDDVGTTGSLAAVGDAGAAAGAKKKSLLKQATSASNPSATSENPPAAAAASTPQPDPLPPYTHFLILRPSPPYATADSPSKHAQRLVQWYGGSHQPTSVIKAAELVWQLGHCSYPPLRLILGTYAVESVRDRLKGVIEEIEDWKHLHYPAVGGWEGEGDEGSGEEGEGDGGGDVKGEDGEVDGDEDVEMDEGDG